MILANFLFTSIFSFFSLFVMSLFIACLIAIAINHSYSAISYIQQQPNNLFWVITNHRHHHSQLVHRHDDENVHVHGHHW